MTELLIAAALAAAVGLGAGFLLALSMTLRLLRDVRDGLPLLKPTDGNVAATMLAEWMSDRAETGFSADDVDAVNRVIEAGVTARPALGAAITRFESGGKS